MPTIKLYDDTPYEREFSAVVLDIRASDDNCCVVELDRTLFFPEEGGQTSDTGTLGGFEVSHVSIDGETIRHTVRCRVLDMSRGDEVQGIIDWDHRFSNMQNHTGEHILSGLLHSRWGSENTGFHLSDSIVTLDTSKELDEASIKELEHEANVVIYKDLPVTCRYYSQSELKEKEYRSKKDFESDVRLVTIPDVDICACCAPHVSRTGEIGLIKIIKAIRYKGGMRLTILSGERAYEYVRSVHEIVEDLSHILSEQPDKLQDAVNRILNEMNALKIKIKNSAKAKLDADIEALPPDTHDAILFTDAVDNIVQRNAVNLLAEKHTGICAIFAADGKDGYNYICSLPGNDARDISKLLHEKLEARGGGSKEMVQGNVSSAKDDIRRVLTEYSANE